MKAVFTHRLFSRAGLARALHGLTRRLGSRSPLPEEIKAKPPTKTTQTFLTDLLPKMLGQQVLAVSAEDDLLRVRTNRGETLVAGCFVRALEEDLGRRHGVQIHRSHWVALDPVPQLLKMSGQWYCVVDDGTRLPISRRRRSEVRRLLAGQWADDPSAGANSRLASQS